MSLISHDRNTQNELSLREWTFLTKEIDQWCREGIISEEQSSLLVGRYTQKRRYFHEKLFVFGGILLGLAFLSFVAAHWLDVSRVLRVAIILSGYALLNFSAFMTETKHPKLSRTFLLLASFAYGGGIFLIGQMFHMGGTWTDALFLWMAGLLPAAWIFSDKWQQRLVLVLYCVWIVAVFEEQIFSCRGSSCSTYPPVLLGGLAVPFLWGVWWKNTKQEWNGTLFATLCYLMFCGQSYRNEVLWMLLYAVSLGGMTCLLSYCLEETRRCDTFRWGILFVGAAGLLLTLPEVWSDRGGFVYVPVFGAVSADQFYAVSSAVLLSSVMSLVAAHGNGWAAFFLIAVILRYYLDYFYAFMPKAFFFATGGALLILMGVLLNRLRHRSNAVKKASTGEGQIDG